MNADASPRPLAQPLHHAYTSPSCPQSVPGSPRTGGAGEERVEPGQMGLATFGASSTSGEAAARASRSPSWLRVALTGLLAGLGLAVGACSDADVAPAAPPAATSPFAPQVGQVSLSTACVDGTVEPCSEMLGEHAGIVSCVSGTRVCTAGTFGACVGNEVYDVRRSDTNTAGPDGIGARLLAFSSSTACTNNPCNGYCREFNEAPPEGLVPDYDTTAPPLSSWITGNVADYPPEWVVVGKQEPCQVAGDCQFNTECVDPSLGSCSHNVCATGEALVPSCSRCADTVCAEEPDCCGVPPACNHDPCEVGNGAPLDPTCDVCVEAVCAAHPECCSATWNDACIGYIATECQATGQSCTCPNGGTELNGTCYVAGEDPSDWFLARDACGAFGSGWNMIQVNDAAENELARAQVTSEGGDHVWLGGIEAGVDQWTWQGASDVFFVSDASGGQLQPGYTYSNWAAGEPELAVSGRAIALDTQGEWRDAQLSAAFGYVCEGPKNRLGPTRSPYSWSARCTELAESACGVTCSDGAALGIGSCTPRVPTELDEGCTSFDLALGATCEAGGLPQLPVCNHGQSAAPAGLRLVHLPMDEMGRAVPDLSDAGDCVLSEPIPPGRCVTVTDCPGLTADRALVVNPVDGAQNTAECRLDDNWSIYQPLPCRPTTCESSVHDASLVEARGCGIRLQNPLGVDRDLARVTLGSEVPEPTCGANEIRWGASCYFFSTNSETWDAARDRCTGRGGGWDLVALNSPAENVWLRSQTDPLQDIQIGLTDRDVEGDHVWSNGSCRSYTNWDATSVSPNNAPPGSEQCVRMTAAAVTGWEDEPCNDGLHPYVCEGPVLDARGGCASGQLAGPDGNCYALDPAGLSFAAARASCLALGPGWKLASIDDAPTNEFVTSLLGCREAWLSNQPGLLANWATVEPDVSNDLYIDALGVWHGTTDGAPRATLCQGPATATGAPELAQVAEVGACSLTDDRQYYFLGNDTAPETLQLCPNTCDAAAAVPGRRIGVEIACVPPPPPALVTERVQVYDPTCTGTQPQWDFLYYDAITPADSRIEFAIRSAATQAELDADTIPYVTVAEAHAVPTDTQSCEAVSDTCPIDIFHPLGEAAQSQQIDLLQLRVRLIPGSSGEGPVVRDWKIRFSCPPAQ
jgi:hypothetical protein